MADIYAALCVLCRLMASNPREVRVPKRAETLKAWCLPMLSKSLEADEKEREALELYNSVKRLKERFEK